MLFEKSQSAFQAFSSHRNGIISSPNLRHIVPANTWHQPDSISLWNTVEPEKCTISKLNDHCLLEIFKYLELDALVNVASVCTRFQGLLDAYHFSKVKSYTAFVYHAPVNALRRTMKRIGPHLNHLYLRYQKYGEAPHNYIGVEHEERVTYKILQNISSNLTKFTIRKPPGQKPSNKVLQLFRSAFCQITFLEWDAEFDCSTIQKLREYCPYIETLVLRKRIFTCKHEHESSDLQWPTLRSLETFQYMAALDSPCQRFFERFIQENPQLQRLKLTNVNDDLFRVITQYSQNLEYLEMLQNFDLCKVHTQPTLDLLHNLTNLKVFVIRVRKTEFLREVENQIQCLKQMHHLELIVLLRNYSPPVWPNEQFPYAHHWSELVVEGQNLKLRIGDNSTNIAFSAGKTTLVNIFNTNNPKESRYRQLKRDVRYVFQITKEFFPEEPQEITFENCDCWQFIHVSSIL